MADRPTFCFVSMEVYATLRPGSAPFAGGAGFQLVQLASGLRDAGYRVDFIVGDFGQPEEEHIDGFRVLRANRVAYDRSLRRGAANVVRLWRAMRRSGADVFVLRSTEFLAPQVYAFARLMGRRYVFMVAIDSNCRPRSGGHLRRLWHRAYVGTLHRADAVTAQSGHQQELLEKNFNVVSLPVPNGIEPPDPAEFPPAVHDVAWVAKLMPAKRPDLLCDLAAACPDLDFVVAGGPGEDRSYFEKLAARLESLPNVTYLGFVPPDQVAGVYASAHVLLNTSDDEGFPNTFLYAWSLERPVVTRLIDPDGVIERQGLGVREPDLKRLGERLRELVADTERRREMGLRCRRHVLRNHSRQALTAAFLAAVGEERHG